jgi:phosphatidate phosphatase PAH1
VAIRGTHERKSSTTTTSNAKEFKVQKKYVAFNIKQQRKVFLELNYKERKIMMYVDGGRAMAAMSI